jgi:hypothetical protein
VATLGRKPTAWTPEMDALLGTTTDAAAAARLGLSSATISNRRMALGIPPFRRHENRQPETWSAEHIALLGTRVDREIARLVGCCPATVAAKREALGIPAKGPPRFDWSPYVAELGRTSDADLARRLKVSATSVWQARVSYGIPCFRRPITRLQFSSSVLLAVTAAGWRFRCRCGREFVTPEKPGRAVRCGKCGRGQDYTGRRYNLLTALEHAGKSPTGQPRWLFRCRCGTEKVIVLYSVTSGKQKSCGCFGRKLRARLGARTKKRWAKRTRPGGKTK